MQAARHLVFQQWTGEDTAMVRQVQGQILKPPVNADP
jgi:hypothetical protein